MKALGFVTASYQALEDRVVFDAEMHLKNKGFNFKKHIKCIEKILNIQSQR